MTVQIGAFIVWRKFTESVHYGFYFNNMNTFKKIKQDFKGKEYLTVDEVMQIKK